MFRRILILFVILLISSSVVMAAPPTQFKEVSSVGGSGLSGKIFVNDSATGYSAEWTADGRIAISSIIHETNKTVRIQMNALSAVNGFSGNSAKVTHINDAGVIDSERIVQFGTPDAQGFVTFTTDFSTVIIGGFQGSYTISCGGVQDNSTNCSLGQSFLGGNVSAFTGTITPATTEVSKYDYITSLNPFVWLRFDDTYIDSSGNGYNGTSVGSPIFINGKYNNGTYSDGNDAIQIPKPSINNSSFSFFAYGSLEDGISFNNILGADHVNSRAFIFFKSSTNKLSFMWSQDGTLNTDKTVTSTSIFDNTSHFFGVVFDNATIKLYLDNEVVNVPSVYESVNQPANYYYIGYSAWSGVYSTGGLDNILIFNKTFSDSEVALIRYDFLQQFRIKSTTNATWSDYYNSTADNPISINYNIDETISTLQFDVPTTAVIDNVTIYDYNKTAQFTPSATVYYGENVTLVTESAAAGLYILNITQTPTNSGAGWINYTTSNSLLLNADFNNSHTFTTDNPNASVQINLPNINISTGDINAAETKYYNISIDYFYPPTGLTPTLGIADVLLNWTDTPNADKYSIYELEEGIPWFDTQPILDGTIDDIYLELSHHFHINSPNPANDTDFDVLYMGRDADFVYLSGTAIDNDGLSLDDYARLYTDFTKDGLTTDDLMYQIRESGATSCNGWSGSSWGPCGSSGVTGATTGAGTNLITYELRVPVSELPANWVNGTNVRMLLEREDTSQNPNVFSYYPQTNINNTDSVLWQDIKLSNTTEYRFIANTTNNFYDVEGLIPFTWYRFGVSAWNGSQETSLSVANVTTLDIPQYNVSGYVLDLDSGLGISSASVWVRNGFTLATTSTNSTGYYKFSNIHNATYRIFADASMHFQNNTSFFDVLGSDIINKNVTLEPLPIYSVSGYVYNTTGEGMSNATVTINGFTNLTNSTGFYTVEGLMDGTYTGTASLNGYTSNEITIVVFGSDVTNQNIILYVVEKLTSYIIYFILIISPTLIFVGNRMKIIGMLFVLTTYILFIFPGGWTPGELYVFAAGILFGFANIFNEDRLKYN